MKNTEKGQGLVEFALIFPLLFMLIMGIISMGILFHDSGDSLKGMNSYGHLH